MKRLWYLIKYIRLVKKNKKVLEESIINNNSQGIKYDWIFRLYTVLNLPFDDKDNIEKYGYYYVDNMVRKHVNEISNFLLEIGLLEFVTLDTENIQQIDEYNIRIVLRFKYLNTKILARLIIVLLFLILFVGIPFLFFI